jgi:hypothetical protein
MKVVMTFTAYTNEVQILYQVRIFLEKLFKASFPLYFYHISLLQSILRLHSLSILEKRRVCLTHLMRRWKRVFQAVRSPFVHKKSQEVYAFQKRMLDVVFQVGPNTISNKRWEHSFYSWMLFLQNHEEIRHLHSSVMRSKRTVILYI